MVWRYDMMNSCIFTFDLSKFLMPTVESCSEDVHCRLCRQTELSGQSTQAEHVQVVGSETRLYLQASASLGQPSTTPSESTSMTMVFQPHLVLRLAECQRLQLHAIHPHFATPVFSLSVSLSFIALRGRPIASATFVWRVSSIDLRLSWPLSVVSQPNPPSKG